MPLPPKYPNLLQQFIDRAGIKPAELARQVGTSRQQIHSLAIGERELTKAWAERLAPPLKTTWAALLGASPPGFQEAPAEYIGAPSPHTLDEFDRLPELAEMLAKTLIERDVTIGIRRITLHAVDALHQAMRMDRRLPFEERARIAIEAKASDISRMLG